MKEVVHLRQVRSFVRRQARFTLGQKRALSELWPIYGLELNEEPLDYTKIFGRKAPLVLEIGFGMGNSLLTLAKTNPDRDYIGIEVHSPGVACLMRNLAEQELSNVRIFKTDAHDVLEKSIADASLSEVLLFFPDPWPKKRHQKRRIVQSKFIELVRQKLIAGGVFHLATDWQDYAEQMLNLLEASVGFTNSSGKGNFAARPESRPLTKFEARGQKLGHGVWDLLFVKDPD